MGEGGRHCLEDGVSHCGSDCIDVTRLKISSHGMRVSAMITNLRFISFICGCGYV